MSFEIKIIYGQISVFNSDLDSPYNDWSEKSQFQGFSWREGSVSFSVKDQDEPYSIFINEEFDTDIADTIIKVPFTSRGLCEIGSLLATKEIELTEGDYVLMFFKSEKENSIFLILQNLQVK